MSAQPTLHALPVLSSLQPLPESQEQIDRIRGEAGGAIGQDRAGIDWLGVGRSITTAYARHLQRRGDLDRWLVSERR